MNQSRVVVVVLRGGVGNQLFQYAAGLAAARRMDARIAFQRVEAGSVRLDEVLQRDLEEASPQLLHRLGVITRDPGLARGRERLNRRLLLAQGRVTQVRQRWEEALAPMPDHLMDLETSDLYLDGYFQHPSWFEPSLEETASQLAARLNQFAKRVVGRDATVVSFRRGDYVRLGWDLPLSYYERALALVPPRSGPLWIVGDDRVIVELFGEWIQQRGFSVSPPPELGADRFLRDLSLLSAADQVIMSNSTYCWWGVNAGDPDATRGDRVIVSPRPWLPLSGSNALVRPGWRTAETTPEWSVQADGP